MRIIFTVEAKRDLDDLRAFLEPLSPAGLANVVAALEARILQIEANPRIGRPTPRADVREVIEAKYGFLIPYLIKGEALFILRVYRARRRPLDYVGMELPSG